MKGYFMYGIVVSHETYLNLKLGNTIEEIIINTNEVQGIFAGRHSNFVIVGTVLKEVTTETTEPHEVPVMTRTGEEMILERVKNKFGVTGEGHYYFVTR